MKHITWLEVAERLLYGDWGRKGETTKKLIEESSYTELQLALLIEIAKSLRRLRCHEFQAIPDYLKSIRANTSRKRKKSGNRKK